MIEKPTYDCFVDMVNETFDYAKKLALDALNQKTIRMSFLISFEEGCAPTVNHDITEYYA